MSVRHSYLQNYREGNKKDRNIENWGFACLVSGSRENEAKQNLWHIGVIGHFHH